METWKSWSGVFVTVVSAAGLALCLWQTSRLDTLGGLDSTAAERYRLALRATQPIAPALNAVDRFRQVAVFGGTPVNAREVRAATDERLRAVGTWFGAGRPAATLDPQGTWQAAQRTWVALRGMKPGTSDVLSFRDLSRSLSMLGYDALDRSGMNYDLNSATQFLGSVALESAPWVVNSVNTTRIATRAALRKPMTLEERIAFSTALSTLQSNAEQSDDDIATVRSYMKKLDPARAAAFASLLPLSREMTRAGDAYYEALNRDVLRPQRPAITPRTVDQLANAVLSANRRYSDEASAALSEIITSRQNIFERRRSLVPLAYIAAGLLVVGLMLVTAQLVSWRNLEALRSAREESKRLAAELGRQRAEDALRRVEERRLELETMVALDPLTGVLNRRAFDAALSELWEAAVATGRALGLIMIDVDHFKLFNDRYGHQAGDECLRAVAHACAGAVRSEDVFARYGGEEFVVIVPKATTGEVEMIGDRMRAAVRALNVEHCTEVRRVTLSIGAAALDPAREGNAGDLIRLADESLYRAKHGGRDRIVLSWAK